MPFVAPAAQQLAQAQPRMKPQMNMGANNPYASIGGTAPIRPGVVRAPAQPGGGQMQAGMSKYLGQVPPKGGGMSTQLGGMLQGMPTMKARPGSWSKMDPGFSGGIPQGPQTMGMMDRMPSRGGEAFRGQVPRPGGTAPIQPGAVRLPPQALGGMQLGGGMQGAALPLQAQAPAGVQQHQVMQRTSRAVPQLGGMRGASQAPAFR